MIELVVSLDNLTNDVANAVYQIKVTGVNLVVCLLPSHLTELVFRAGERYQLLDYSIVWMTLQLDGSVNHVQGKLLPWQWIDLRFATNQQQEQNSGLASITTVSLERNFELIKKMILEGFSIDTM